MTKENKYKYSNVNIENNNKKEYGREKKAKHCNKM